MSLFSSVGKFLCKKYAASATTRPAKTPPATIHKKLAAALYQINCPVVTATAAKRKMMSEEASFKRLSPSKIALILRGALTNLRIAAVLTASGGETIAPSMKPRASEKPGITKFAIKATAAALTKTTIKAKLPIVRRHL